MVEKLDIHHEISHNHNHAKMGNEIPYKSHTSYTINKTIHKTSSESVSYIYINVEEEKTFKACYMLYIMMYYYLGW